MRKADSNVVILGAGPAGATASIFLAKHFGVKVIAVDYS